MTRAERFFGWLTRVQAQHPFRVLALVALTALPAAWAAMHLELRTEWSELLPENKPSIADLKRIQERFGGTGTLLVFCEGGAPQAMQRFADALAPHLAALAPDLVRFVDKDLIAEREFFKANRYLYPAIDELGSIRDRLKQTVSERKAKAVFDLGLDEDDDDAPIADDAFNLDDVKQRYDDALGNFDRFRDGYFMPQDGSFLVLFVRTAYTGAKLALTDRLEREVLKAVAEVGPEHFDPAIKVSLSGNVLRAREEHHAMRDELLVITVLVAVLILGSIYLFYWQVLPIVVQGVALLVGVLWTFGLTWWHIGYLSTATAFLASIVPGNGINPSIMLISRYLEERRAGRAGRDAVLPAMLGTWAGTLTAAGAASLAYGALMLTDFRGFSQFGFIGGFGLMLCWAAAYIVLPPLLILTESRSSLGDAKSMRRGAYGRPFLWLSRRWPRGAIASGLLLALVGIGFGYAWIHDDPFEYDFRKLRSDRTDKGGLGAIQSTVNGLMQGRDREAVVVLADRPEQVPLLVDALERLHHEADPPIGRVKSLGTLVPDHQDDKRALLEDIRAIATGILPRLSPAKRAELEPWIPPATIAPITTASVPPSLLRPLTEKNGQVGLVIQVNHADKVSVWDGRGLLRLAAAVRAITLPNGEVIRSSGTPVIFADMLQAILEDGPWLTLASLGAIVALVVLTFRRLAPTAIVIFALLIGMSWMVGGAALSGMRLNFLNFIAIPITFGIGVEYAVNMVRRYTLEGWGETEQVLLETGGAVTLCSLTTIWGYLSLLYSDNQALRSFGKLAVLGEFTCLAAAMVIVPSVVTVFMRRRERSTKP